MDVCTMWGWMGCVLGGLGWMCVPSGGGWGVCTRWVGVDVCTMWGWMGCVLGGLGWMCVPSGGGWGVY